MEIDETLLARVGATLAEQGWVTSDQFRRALDEARKVTGSTAVPKAGEPRQVGRFILMREIGRGGYGSVWKAWQTDLNRFVALKFLRSDDRDDVQRFVREARTAAGLNHPNIVSIYEVGEDDGSHFIAMEFIDGITLARARLAPRDAAARVREAALAIEFAHTKGIIHRDLKPQNLMLDTAGRVCVMDFGLARSVKGGATLTTSGMVVGTPAYMPPEQALGQACDSRSDVYSLGATLYEMLTGMPPFKSDSVLDVFRQIAEREPAPPRHLVPALDRDLETIVLKAMEKQPERRYPGAGAFAEDLRRYLSGEPIVARPVGTVARAVKFARRRPARAAAIAVALAAVTFFAGDAFFFHARVADIVARAKKAEEAHHWAEARDLYGEARALTPGHAVAEECFHRCDRERDADERSRRSHALIVEGMKAEEAHRAIDSRAVQARDEARRLSADIGPWEGPEKKAPLWTVQKSADDADAEIRRAYAETLAKYLSAVGADSANATARNALARFYLSEYERAESRGDSGSLVLAESLARFWDAPSVAGPLAREGTVSIESDPHGAVISAHRYVAGPDRRLVEEPVAWSPGTKLPGGSYLFVLRMPGYRDARVPVFVGRSTAFSEKIVLLKEDEIGAEFVYVPSGPFLMGGDAQAYSAVPRQVKRLDGFCIARFETTMEEYVAFLNDLIKTKGVAEARKRLPRTSPSGGWYWEIPDGAANTSPPAGWARRPVYGVSWFDAVAYAEWKSRKEGRDYRLPTNEEWEKAARGADGRIFPWGDAFDWSFCKGSESREAKPAEQEAIGAFPKDASPYGVRDMAGSIREWCADWFDEKAQLKHMRSGSWGDNDAMYFRCATRFGYDQPQNVYMFDGLRLAHTPRRR